MDATDISGVAEGGTPGNKRLCISFKKLVTPLMDISSTQVISLGDWNAPLHTASVCVRTLLDY